MNYSAVLLQCSTICYYVIHDIAITASEQQSDLELSEDTPYLTVMIQIWGACCENF